MTVFHNIGAELFENTALFDATLTNGIMNDIKPLAIIVLFIFIGWRSIQLMTGTSTKTIQDVFLELLIWSIVFLLSFDSTWLSHVRGGMKAIYTVAGGNITFFDNLDIWWTKLAKVADNLYSKDDSTFFPGRGIFSLFIVMIGTFIITYVPLAVILLTNIAVQILIMVAPFMILAFIFPSVKKIFDNWIEVFLKYILIVLIISLIQKALMTKIDQMLNGFLNISESASAGEIVSAAALIFTMCSLYSFILALSVPIATALSGSYKKLGLGKGI